MFNGEAISRVVALAAAGLIVWLVFRPRYEVVIRIRGGALQVTKGKVTAAQLRAVAETCALHQIETGWIGALRRGKRTFSLRFSRNIPEECRQQLRNIWPVVS